VPALLGGRTVTPAQIRAVELGCKLHEHNSLVQTRARMAATATNRGAPLAAWLLMTARLAETCRGLRRQLAEALAEVEPGPVVDHGPRVWYGPRHRNPDPDLADHWLPEGVGRHAV